MSYWLLGWNFFAKKSRSVDSRIAQQSLFLYPGLTVMGLLNKLALSPWCENSEKPIFGNDCLNSEFL
jgi:hypothetical protein